MVRIDDSHLLLVVLVLDFAELAHIDGGDIEARIRTVRDKRIAEIPQRGELRLGSKRVGEHFRILRRIVIPLPAHKRLSDVFCSEQPIVAGVVFLDLVSRFWRRHVPMRVRTGEECRRSQSQSGRALPGDHRAA